MKKEYLTPDVWVLDLATACMDGVLDNPGSSSKGEDPLYNRPGRHHGPASL